jgi:hypothetical protein
MEENKSRELLRLEKKANKYKEKEDSFEKQMAEARAIRIASEEEAEHLRKKADKRARDAAIYELGGGLVAAFPLLSDDTKHEVGWALTVGLYKPALTRRINAMKRLGLEFK